jgi:type IV pilus assembly protein PilB
MHPTADNNASDFRIGLFAYKQAALTPIEQLIADSPFADNVRFDHADLARAQDAAACDLAITVFDKFCDIDQYKRDIATLKTVKKILIVMSFLLEEDRKIVESQKLDISSNDIISIPLLSEQFFHIIMTRLATIKIWRDVELSRSGTSSSAPSLGDILVQNRIINPLQLQKALDQQKRTNKRLGEVLVEMGYIDEEQKNTFLSSQISVPLATPRQYASANISVIGLIPEHIARQYNCIALEKNGNELSVAMTEVLNLRLLDALRDMTNLSIKPLLGTPADITTSIDRYYRDISSNKDATAFVVDLGDNMEVLQEQKEEINIDVMTAAGAEFGIVKLVNMLITNAVHDRASDIHIEPMAEEVIIRYRIDGDLRHIMSPPRHSHQAIITRIKILSNLDIAERRLPQDGRMVVKIANREVDIRVSVLPGVYGEKVVLRLLDKEAFDKSVSQLGFSTHDFETFQSQITKPYGMVIVTGPTGSGKSTTLYSALQQIKNVARNIITVEDPVEFHIEGITQVQVNSKIGLTFEAALRSILRQDPDIVLIGEIRDDETADIAIKMSMTGHLVFSTLHTNDAAGTISRFTDIGIPPLLLASSLNLIVAQRLVRRICPKCKKEYEPAPELIEQLHLPVDEPHRFFRGEGCVACNGMGYFGRIGIFEMLVVSRDIRTLILRNASTMEIQALAEKEGMKTLRTAGIDLALAGETTIELVIAETTER